MSTSPENRAVPLWHTHLTAPASRVSVPTYADALGPDVQAAGGPGIATVGITGLAALLVPPRTERRTA